LGTAQYQNGKEKIYLNVSENMLSLSSASILKYWEFVSFQHDVKLKTSQQISLVTFMT
jgi:hypothetical protein